MQILTHLLIAVHLVAFFAGASNAILQMLSGPRLAGASPETRGVLYAMQDAAAQLGKICMVTLIATGLLVLWLKWDFGGIGIWFWIKMAAVFAMLIFILLGERLTPAARAAGPEAASAAAAKVLLGQCTSGALLVVIFAAVSAFA